MRKILLFITTILLFGNLYAQELSLEEAIRIGIENNYSVKISKNNQQVSENNNTLGNAGFLPVVNANSSQNYTHQNAEQRFSFDPDSTRISNAKSEVFTASASVSWTIFDGTKMFFTKDRLNELQRNAEISVEREIENSILDISLAYYNIIVQRNRYVVLDSSLSLSKDRLNIAQSKYEVGKASKLEYMSAQVDYNTDLSALLSQEEGLVESRIELNRLLNRDLQTPFDISGEIEIDTTLVLDDLMQDAIAHNTDLNILKSNQLISSLAVKEVRAERFPIISLNAGYNYNNLTAGSGILLANKTNGITYGVSATWNLFNGFNLNRRLQNARIAVNNSQLMIEDFNNQISSQVLRTYKSYENNLKLYQLEKENLDVAQENASIALDRYKLGNSNALELREAQIQSVEAASRLFNASYNTKIAELNLLLMSGRLIKKSDSN